MIGRILIGFALLGPPLIGIVAPLLSFLAFRKRRRALRRPSAIAVVVASVVWLLLCVGTSKVLVYMAFNFAWAWGHVQRPPLTSEELTLMGIVAGGLVLLSACAFALHRLLIVAKRPVSPLVPSG